jgi:hypothetical protein
MSPTFARRTMLDLVPTSRFPAACSKATAALLAASLVACAPIGIPTVVIYPPLPEPELVRELPPEPEPYEPGLPITLAPEAMVPFAAYVDTVHRRLHPSFVDVFLTEFERGRQREPEYATTLAIALGEFDGRLVDLRIVRSSGLDTFDVGAMGALIRASPFGKPPPEIVAHDGNVHLSWRLKRKGPDGCGVQNAFVVAASER